MTPDAAYRCPDCGFTAALAVTVSQHMWDEHNADHPGETPWLNRETGEHYWEDEDALDQ